VDPEDRRPFADNSWGYGAGPRSEDEFYARLEGLVDVLYAYPHIAGYCYTQLTDVEQEQNGIYNYDRSTKFDMEKIAKIFIGKTENRASSQYLVVSTGTKFQFNIIMVIILL
jgi:hypothetical protein